MEKQSVSNENEVSMSSSLEIGPVRLSEEAWEEARRRLKTLQPIFDKSKYSRKDIQLAAKDLSVSERTIFRMIERYNESGGLLSSLAPGLSGRGNVEA